MRLSTSRRLVRSSSVARLLWLTPLWLTPIALGCDTGGGGAPMFVTEAQEIEIGAESHAQLLQEMPLYDDPVVTDYVTQVGQEIVPHSLRPNLQHRFFVLNTEEVNAFAIPGGYVYVTTALIRNMDSRAELAGVIGHEIGHVSAYHGAKALETQFALNLISEFFLGDSEATRQVLDFTVGAYLNTAHSQNQELEADKLGVEFSAASGNNPWGLVSFFEFIRDLSGESDPISNFLSTHPAPADRITDSSAQITALGISKNDPKYPNDKGSVPFSEIKNRVIAASPR
jgi:predicted Zn-dependent protease